MGKEALNLVPQRVSIVLLAGTLLLSQSSALGTVYLNEVFINPPGSLDTTAEFVELSGTPGRKLDGFAIALFDGTEQKYFDFDSIPPLPVLTPEVDELFSLDGLELGRNGLLVLTLAAQGNYTTIVPDTNVRDNWLNIWNGTTEEAGRLQNDGSNTLFLVRNRPGATEADPGNFAGAIWAKDSKCDFQLITPAIDPQSGEMVDQFGDGEIDTGLETGLGSTTRDFKGITTSTKADDLEVVDELSYEHERGWEYDLDGRKVDISSTVPGLPERRVHALDDPQGFNPDCVTRVDYRIRGEGWVPADGGTGEMLNGNNWQDTATEQWIRGESTVMIGPMGPEYIYDHADNENADSIQPFITNVPLWLDDGLAPDYDFNGVYHINAGQTNALAVPFIPGDADRNGIADADDIALYQEFFGDEDWLFPNSDEKAENGDDGDPEMQVRPWDLDGSGDNGIDPGDFQWTLNFLGNTTGRIIGVTYDSMTPESNGVFFNENTGVETEFSWTTEVSSGRPLNDLALNDRITLRVFATVNNGNTNAEEENGVMQVLHNLFVSNSGILQVESVTPGPGFAHTREELLSFAGSLGSLGFRNLNLHTTGFTCGIGGSCELYTVELRVSGLGTAGINLAPAADFNFADTTPDGVKLGRTWQNGNPESADYPVPLLVESTTLSQAGDCDGSQGLSLGDFACLVDCLDGSGPDLDNAGNCSAFDFNDDGDTDLADVAMWSQLHSND